LLRQNERLADRSPTARTWAGERPPTIPNLKGAECSQYSTPHRRSTATEMFQRGNGEIIPATKHIPRQKKPSGNWLRTCGRDALPPVGIPTTASSATWTRSWKPHSTVMVISQLKAGLNPASIWPCAPSAGHGRPAQSHHTQMLGATTAGNSSPSKSSSKLAQMVTGARVNAYTAWGPTPNTGHEQAGRNNGTQRPALGIDSTLGGHAQCGLLISGGL